MPNWLNKLPELINGVFVVLDMIIVRLTLLGLTALGAYAVLCHSRPNRPMRLVARKPQSRSDEAKPPK
jgi:hypothetical protein